MAMTRLEERTEAFAGELEARLRVWLAGEEGAEYPHGRLLAATPDLFRLIVSLLTDERLPSSTRALLVATVVTVVSPSDFLPEALLGPVGFEDDLLVLALVVQRVVGEASPQVVHEHWQGRESLDVIIALALASGAELVGDALWARLRRLVG